MSSRIAVVTIAALFAATSAAWADLKLSNDADIDMTGSAGSQIIFPDGSTMNSALEGGASVPASFYLLAQAMKSLPVGTAYAIWVGIGATGTVILGIILYGESTAPLRLASIGLVILGLAGLRLTE